MNYDTQVNNTHYSKNYDELERFVSYFNQKELILKLGSENSSVLEIGKGSGFLSEYIKRQGLSVKTFDVATDLHPDYLGDIMKIDEVVPERFDIVCAFEVLEHLKFEDLEQVFNRLANVTKKYLLVSIPFIRLYASFWFSAPKVKSFGGSINIPFPKRHVFDGEHYWELGKRGFSPRRFEKIIGRNFDILSNFSHPIDPYHKFYSLVKKDA